MTLTESGRTLAGQTPEAFVATVSHAEPLAVGLNCSFGADSMGKYVEALASVPYAVIVYPNAGLPNEMGEYDQTPSARPRLRNCATASLPAAQGRQVASRSLPGV